MKYPTIPMWNRPSRERIESALPIPADDDAQCPRCGCPTACPEGQIEALMADLTEAKRELCAEIQACEAWRGVALDRTAERDALRVGLRSLAEQFAGEETDALNGGKDFRLYAEAMGHAHRWTTHLLDTGTLPED